MAKVIVNGEIQDTDSAFKNVLNIRTQHRIFYNPKNPFPVITQVEAVPNGDNNELFTIEIKD